jgi:hypothetical protein
MREGGRGPAPYGRRDNLLGFTRTLISAPPTAQALMDKALAASSTAGLLRSVGIVAVHDRDVWAYDGRQPAVPLQAVYPVGGQLAADYPFVLPDAGWTTGTDRAAAGDLRDWLRSSGIEATLGAYGLRQASGQAGPQLTATRGVQAAPIPARA